MPQFFILPEWIKNNKITIFGDEALHIVKVLRKKEGDLIDVFDKNGNRYKIKINSINKIELKGEKKILSLEGEIITQKQYEKENIKIILYQGLIKSNNMDFIIRKCTEIGVHSIVPFFSERCVIKYNKNVFEKKVVRWQKIALQAIKQSLGRKIPQIKNPSVFSDVLMEKRSGLSLIFWEEEINNLKSVLINYKKQVLSGLNRIPEVHVFIGPEGGFSESEIKKAQAANVISVGLGKRILRAETAGIVAISMISYEYLF
ncbi:16S rRNA (uracil(1498)-N(3))-methyltransferase [bacterium]|nr:16S rRNA (uracil(1498)-N(3))-methyltransferase [bacterium]